MSQGRYLGLDLSTQQLKGVVLDTNLRVVHECFVDFDHELPSFNTTEGVHVDATDERIITAPVAMWLAALDRLLEKLSSLDFSAIVAISGAGMQHGTVYWSKFAEAALQGLDSKQLLANQPIAKSVDEIENGALASPSSPNWQDASTDEQCLALEQSAGGEHQLAAITGSRAHHRFSGPQIMKLRQHQSKVYQQSTRISLVSSWLASIIVGRIVPIDLADASGMNLLDLKQYDWCSSLFRTVAGDAETVNDLRSKLGQVNAATQSSLGAIAPYFVNRYGFNKTCKIYPFTGDNPATVLSLPLQEDEAIISLGTSTTLLMSTAMSQPRPEGHLMLHPTTLGLYVFMLCYKNGSLVREKVRNAVDPASATSDSWTGFDTLLNTTPMLGKQSPNSPAKIGLYFQRPEILPPSRPGTFRALCAAGADITLLPDQPDEVLWNVPDDDARAIIEAQFLSIRSRIQDIAPNGLKRIYLAGGAACNNAMAEICGAVLGGTEGIWRLENVKGGSCAVGAANRAAWGYNGERDEAKHDHKELNKQSFQDFLAQNWATDDKPRLSKIAEGHNDAIYARYGEVLEGMRQLEKLVSTTTTD